MTETNYIVPTRFDHRFGIKMIMCCTDFYPVYFQKAIFVADILSIQFDARVFARDLGEFVSVAIVIAPHRVNFDSTFPQLLHHKGCTKVAAVDHLSDAPCLDLLDG